MDSIAVPQDETFGASFEEFIGSFVRCLHQVFHFKQVRLTFLFELCPLIITQLVEGPSLQGRLDVFVPVALDRIDWVVEVTIVLRVEVVIVSVSRLFFELHCYVLIDYNYA